MESKLISIPALCCARSPNLSQRERNMRWATLKRFLIADQTKASSAHTRLPTASHRDVLLTLLWPARLNQSLPGGVSRYRDMRGWIVFLANGGTTLWHPDFNSRRTIPAGNVSHVIAVGVQEP